MAKPTIFDVLASERPEVGQQFADHTVPPRYDWDSPLDPGTEVRVDIHDEPFFNAVVKQNIGRPFLRELLDHLRRGLPRRIVTVTVTTDDETEMFSAVPEELPLEPPPRRRIRLLPRRRAE
jgi:hypothetical protein